MFICTKKNIFAPPAVSAKKHRYIISVLAGQEFWYVTFITTFIYKKTQNQRYFAVLAGYTETDRFIILGGAYNPQNHSAVKKRNKIGGPTCRSLNILLYEFLALVSELN